jgi:murein DD-endopeptidase MepM/ murein hydrolase activator NlpD
MRFLLALLLCTFINTAFAVELNGEAIQGGLIFGKAEPGSSVSLDDQAVVVSEEGHFVIGFGRDETGTRNLQVTSPGGKLFSKSIPVERREYAIERVDGLPPATVTPDPAATARIKEDARMVASARQHRDSRAYYGNGFAWPAKGRISFGLDIAAPEGADVLAPADGLITLTHPDMYFSGGTIVLDHGQGLSSSFLHLSKILVEAGTFVKQGDLIARVGATGRASGPHLDWRMNWLDRRVNPQPLLPQMDNP